MNPELKELLDKIFKELEKANKLSAIHAALGIEQLGIPGSLIKNLLNTSKDHDFEELKEILNDIQKVKDMAFRPGP